MKKSNFIKYNVTFLVVVVHVMTVVVVDVVSMLFSLKMSHTSTTSIYMAIFRLEKNY